MRRWHRRGFFGLPGPASKNRSEDQADDDEPDEAERDGAARPAPPALRTIDDRLERERYEVFLVARHGHGAIRPRDLEPGDRFLVIVNGRARVERDGKLLRELGPGAFLSEISLADKSARTATVIHPLD